jgi:phosphohistidine phosphatase
LALRGIRPDLILSASSLRAQRTADGLAERLEYEGRVHYLQELYRSDPETVLEILSLQEDEADEIFVILHNPELSEVANLLGQDHFGKIPALGVVALSFEIESWEELGERARGETEFFIYPKQFRYYMPRQIRATLGEG